MGAPADGGGGTLCMPDEPKSLPSSFNFDYLKGNQFRVIHADGAFFALTAQGLTVSFFSERQPIPRRVVHKVNRDGTLGEEIQEERVVRDAMIRDVDVAVTMNIDTAKRLSQTLIEMIRKFEEISGAKGQRK
jgi:hypothetical protein